MKRIGKNTKTQVTLAEDKNGNVIQVASYNTASYQNLDGTSASAISSEFTEDTMVRIKAYDADSWITISSDSSAAVADTGLLLGTNEELTILVYNGTKIATIGGKLNIVSINN